ncbi:MAG: hypothetical protein CSA72_00170 [Rhodobacterales bacterium]|nr:MAG: hypothetical protein CR993_06155 [Rhodobacterales bacterium]PIE12474.1 MAG: hypothetical protein CSA72_00170 [Rhodobacterales bacterium]
MTTTPKRRLFAATLLLLALKLLFDTVVLNLPTLSMSDPFERFKLYEALYFFGAILFQLFFITLIATLAVRAREIGASGLRLAAWLVALVPLVQLVFQVTTLGTMAGAEAPAPVYYFFNDFFDHYPGLMQFFAQAPLAALAIALATAPGPRALMGPAQAALGPALALLFLLTPLAPWALITGTVLLGLLVLVAPFSAMRADPRGPEWPLAALIAALVIVQALTTLNADNILYALGNTAGSIGGGYVFLVPLMVGLTYAPNAFGSARFSIGIALLAAAYALLTLFPLLRNAGHGTTNLAFTIRSAGWWPFPRGFETAFTSAQSLLALATTGAILWAAFRLWRGRSGE